MDYGQAKRQLLNYMPKWWHWLLGVLVILVSFKYIHGISNHEFWRLPRPTVYYGVLVPFVLAFCDRKIESNNQSFRIPALLLAIVFAQFVSIGEEYYTFHDWNLCFDSSTSVILWLLQSCCYAFVFYKMILAAYHCIDHVEEHRNSENLNLKKWFYVIIATRLCFFAAFYPCIFDFDAALSLRTFLDPDCPICDHHPVFVQAVQAFFFNFGDMIGHRSVGMAILSLIYIFSSTLVLIYGGKLVNISKISLFWKRLIMVLYTLWPLFPFLSLFVTKDGFFSYAFLLYIFSLYEMYLTKANCLKSKRFVFLHILSILLVCLTRHQGIYLVILETVTLLLCYRAFWQRILVTSAVPVTLFFVFNNVLLPRLDVEPGGKQEMYGLFFQQTAYCLKMHPEDVTEQEINQINQVLDSKVLAEKYSDLKTDPVKRGYKFNPTFLYQYRHIERIGESEAMREYMKAWFSMGLRHPLTYLQASATIFLGFFYNDELPLISPYTRWATNRKATRPEFCFWHIDKVAEFYIVREFNWVLIPVINILLGIPYFNWLAILFLSILAYRRNWKRFFTFFPILLSVGVLFICPIVDGRYVYPIVACLPLMLMSLIHKEDKTINQ